MVGGKINSKEEVNQRVYNANDAALFGLQCNNGREGGFREGGFFFFVQIPLVIVWWLVKERIRCRP
jgi:hypothetical protein